MVHQPIHTSGFIYYYSNLDFQDYTHFIAVVILLVKGGNDKAKAKDDFLLNIMTLWTRKGKTHYNQC